MSGSSSSHDVTDHERRMTLPSRPEAMDFVTWQPGNLLDFIVDQCLDAQNNYKACDYGKSYDTAYVAYKALGAFVHHRKLMPYDQKQQSVGSVQLCHNPMPGINEHPFPDGPEQVPLDPVYPRRILHPKHDQAWKYLLSLLTWSHIYFPFSSTDVSYLYAITGTRSSTPTPMLRPSCKRSATRSKIGRRKIAL